MVILYNIHHYTLGLNIGKVPVTTTDYQEVKEKGGKIATGFAPGLELDDDNQLRKEQYKLDQKAKKFGFSDAKSANTKHVLNNLDTTVEDFISKYRKGSIYSEFPGEYLHDKAGNPITIREALNNGGRTVRKLLIDKRFSK